MKKLMTVAALVASALIFTGCGGKPKVPANTVAAAYVDLENYVDGVIDVVDDAIDEIPNKEKRKEIREEFKKFVKEHRPDIKAIDPEWATLTIGLDAKGNPEPALVVKCNCKKNIPSVGKNLKELVAGNQKAVKSGDKYETYKNNLGGIGMMLLPFMSGGNVFITVAKDEYVILTGSEDVMSKMVDLYVYGKGETSDDFDDLADVGGDTIIRIQTAKVETVAEMVGAKETIEKFFKDAGDEDMAELLLDIESISLDIKSSDDIVGAVLSVDAGSRELAKVVESAFNVLAFAVRVGVDTVAGTPEAYRSRLGSFFGGMKPISKDVFAKMVRAIADEVRDGVEVDRSGSTATFAVELDTGDLLEAIVPAVYE